jgi:hypothetical protein
MTATYKRLLISENRDNLNRCTPSKGKPDQYDIYASHVSPRTSDVSFLRTVHVHDNLSPVPTELKHAPTPGRSFGDQRQIDLSVTSGHLIPPLSRSLSRGERFQPNGYIANSAYWIHKHQHVIDMFSTCPRVPTTWSLTDTGGGYHIETSK